MDGANSPLFLSERINLWRSAGSPRFVSASAKRCLAEAVSLNQDLPIRLSCEDLTVDDVQCALSFRGSSVQVVEAKYFDRFNNCVIEPIKRIDNLQSYIDAEMHYGVPFFSLFAPAVESEFEQCFKGKIDLSESALRSAVLGVVRSVSDKFSRVPLLILREYRDRHRSLSYLNFVRYFSDSQGLLVREFPMFTRLVPHAIEAYCRNVAVLLMRFETDRANLCDRGMMVVGDCIHRIEIGLSDPHCGLQTACVLTLASGKKIIYKPKDLTFEMWASSIIAEVELSAGVAPFTIPETIAKGGYGWMDFVVRDTHIDQRELPELFERLGCLLAAAHSLNATDLHAENILIAGKRPVLVDLETLFTPLVGNLLVPGKDTKCAIHDLVDLSVLRTFLIPNWLHVPALNLVIDMSALSGQRAQKSSISVLSWSACGTLSMDCIPIRPVTGVGNIFPPTDEGAAVNPSSYTEFILAGFRKGYLAIKSEKKLALKALEEVSGGSAVRIVLRNTRVYTWLLYRLTEPACLTDGALYSLECYRLLSSPNVDKPHELNMRIFQEERLALEHLDVPKVEIEFSKNFLSVNGRKVGVTSGRTPLKSARRKIRLLSNRDMDVQIGIIRAAFSRPDPRHEQNTTTKFEIVVPPQDPAFNLVLATINSLHDFAMLARSGCRWLTAKSRVPNHAQWTLTDDGVYSGGLGIALFLAKAIELGVLANKELLCEIVATWAVQVQENTDVSARNPTRTLSVGEYGQALACLCAIEESTPGVISTEIFKNTFVALQQCLLERACVFDALGGRAGALLGLLRLASFHDPSNCLSLAENLAWDLVKSREVGVGGLRGWRSIDGHFLSGFAHGQAGIAFSLMQFYLRSQNKEIIEAAEEAMLLENETFDPITLNWKDHRIGSDNLAAWSWCHGAPGMALSRCLYRRVTRSDRFDGDLRAFGSRFESWNPDIMTVCCGAFGILECARIVARSMNCSTLSRMIDEKQFGLDIAIDQRRGVLCFENIPTTSFTPGLFQGWTGVAYLHLCRHLGGGGIDSQLITFGHSVLDSSNPPPPKG